MLDSYIYGFERQRSSFESGGDPGSVEQAGSTLASIPPSAYPSLAGVAEAFATTPYDDAAAFDFGLGLIIDGLERQVEGEVSDGS